MINMPYFAIQPDNRGSRMLLFHFSQLSFKVDTVVCFFILLFYIIICFGRVQPLIGVDRAIAIGHNNRELGVFGNGFDHIGEAVIIIHHQRLLRYLYIELKLNLFFPFHFFDKKVGIDHRGRTDNNCKNKKEEFPAAFFFVGIHRICSQITK